MKSSQCAFTAWCCICTSPNIATHFVHPSHLSMYHTTLSPHTGKKLYSLAFVGKDVDDPVTRADGEHGEVGESSLELGIAVFAVDEPAKL